MKPKKSNLIIQFRQSSSEDIAVDRKTLSRLAASPDALERAERYGDSLYNSARRGEEARTTRLVDFLCKQAERADKELKTREQERDDFLRSPNLNEDEKPVMSRNIIRAQRFLILGIVVLLIIGTAAVSIYLMRWGEPFMTSVTKSVLFALTMTVLMAMAFKAFLSTFKSERIQGGLAIVLSIIGVAAGIFALTANSHFYAPEPKGAAMDRLNEALSIEFPDEDPVTDSPLDETEESFPSVSLIEDPTAGIDAPMEDAGSFWTHQATPWVLEAQILAEASIASVFGFFYCRNRRSHREVSARRTPEFKDLEKRIVDAEAAVRKVYEELGEAEGDVEAFVSARNVFTEEVVGQVVALQHSQNMITSLSETEFPAA